jgi:hypothetical protein
MHHFDSTTSHFPASEESLFNSMSKLVRIVIQLPLDLKLKLDQLKLQGYTASGFIRAMLEQEFRKPDRKLNNPEKDGTDN